MLRALLALEDGRVFDGVSCGASGETCGEIVFNTGMTGYQEILTDPSYARQIITMTYPHIGNYGVNAEDVESRRVFAAGLVVRELSSRFSNWRADHSLKDFLLEQGVVAAEGVDTRALVRHIRSAGAMRAVLSTVDLDKSSLVDKARNSQAMVGWDLAKEVTANGPYEFGPEGRFSAADSPFRVVAYDFGIKLNILRLLVEAGCRVEVVPAQTTAEETLARRPDGVLLSNGPGDPAAVSYAVEAVRGLVGKVPVFGICLGHQILALAFGGKTFKLKFGHRGGNQPVKDLRTGRVHITSQNHGFAVDADSLASSEFEVTHLNLNDRTVEGLVHRELPVSSVQYHPEARPGPWDNEYIFSDFVAQIKTSGGGGGRRSPARRS